MKKIVGIVILLFIATIFVPGMVQSVKADEEQDSITYRPDLLSVTYGYKDWLGQWKAFCDTKNNGNLAAGPFRTIFYLDYGTDSQQTLGVDWRLGLGVGNTVEQSSDPFGASGTHNIRVEIDDWNTVIESNENNNIYSHDFDFD